MHWDDQPCIIAHPRKIASLQIGRQAAVARPPITTLQGLPGKIIVVARVPINQAQQSPVKHLVERRAAAKQGPLLRRHAEAQEQRRCPCQQPDWSRMKQAIEPRERLDALGRIELPRQQGIEIDAGEPRHEMCKPDEAAEHAMAVESVGEVGIARPADNVALVPIGTCLRIEPRPQPRAIELRVGGRCRLAEELPEVGIRWRTPGCRRA